MGFQLPTSTGEFTGFLPSTVSISDCLGFAHQRGSIASIVLRIPEKVLEPILPNLHRKI